MKEYQSLSHTRWDCKYHVVFIPKRRKKLIFVKLRKLSVKYYMTLQTRRKVRFWKAIYAGSHTHVYKYTAEVFGIAGCWFHKRQKCDSNSATIW
jgi:putative transposase